MSVIHKVPDFDSDCDWYKIYNEQTVRICYSGTQANPKYEKECHDAKGEPHADNARSVHHLCQLICFVVDFFELNAALVTDAQVFLLPTKEQASLEHVLKPVRKYWHIS